MPLKLLICIDIDLLLKNDVYFIYCKVCTCKRNNVLHSAIFLYLFKHSVKTMSLWQKYWFFSIVIVNVLLFFLNEDFIIVKSWMLLVSTCGIMLLWIFCMVALIRSKCYLRANMTGFIIRSKSIYIAFDNVFKISTNPLFYLSFHLRCIDSERTIQEMWPIGLSKYWKYCCPMFWVFQSTESPVIHVLS